MRTFALFILFCLLVISAAAENTVFEKLRELNACWSERTDLRKPDPCPVSILSERDWIRYHLQLVEQTLRDRSVQSIDAEQLRQRLSSLDDLNRYWKAGAFPVNEVCAHRTPVFIDDHQNFCAVGYLLKASGHEGLARKISATANLAYLRQIQNPELDRWADAHGFTLDELAWIQPTYGPLYTSSHVGNGTNGEVRTFHVDEAAGKLYVGGDFTLVDSVLPVPYIACVTESRSGFSWQAIGTGGPSGQVYAITQFDGNLFAAGADGADIWDGTSWRRAGSCRCAMRALQAMNGVLYAVGEISDAGGNTGTFARWDGTDWQLIPGLSGTVNTMAVSDSKLIIGGDFQLRGSAANAVSWSPSGSFVPFDTPLDNEVLDFETLNDTLYAACRRSAVDSTHMLMRLERNNWVNAIGNTYSENLYGANRSFHTLCADGLNLVVGGTFRYYPLIGVAGMNVMSFRSLNGMLYDTYGEWISVDGPVNKIIRFGPYLIHGGAMPGYKNITAARMEPARVPRAVLASFVLSPNPVQSRGRLQISGNQFRGGFCIRDMAGRRLLEGELQQHRTPEIVLPQMSPGLYLLQLDDKGGSISQTFTVR